MEDKKAETKSKVIEKESEDEEQAGGSKASPQLRSTMIKEETGPREAKERKARAGIMATLTGEFVAIWGRLSTRQLVMMALVIAIGMVLGGLIGARLATRTALSTRVGDLEQRVAELSNNLGSLGIQVKDLQNLSRAGSPSAAPSSDEGAGPPESAAPSAQPSE